MFRVCCALGMLLTWSACSEGTSGIVLGDIDAQTAEVGGVGGQQPKSPITDPEPASGGQERQAGQGGSAPTPVTWRGESCAPNVMFENKDATTDGVAAEGYLAPPVEVVQGVSMDICAMLYSASDQVPPVPELTLILEASADPGAIAGTSLHISTTHLAAIEQEEDAASEARGILFFLMAHLYLQAQEDTPAWVLSGMADYVRLSAGYIDPNTRSPGGAATDGFRRAAFFFAWIEEEHPNFVRALNGRLASGDEPYSDNVFQDLTGQSLGALWDSYQAVIL